MSRFFFHLFYYYWGKEKEKVWASGFVLNVNACRTNGLNHVKWRTESKKVASKLYLDRFFQKKNNSNKRFF